MTPTRTTRRRHLITAATLSACLVGGSQTPSAVAADGTPSSGDLSITGLRYGVIDFGGPACGYEIQFADATLAAEHKYAPSALDGTDAPAERSSSGYYVTGAEIARDQDGWIRTGEVNFIDYDTDGVCEDRSGLTRTVRMQEFVNDVSTDTVVVTLVATQGPSADPCDGQPLVAKWSKKTSSGAPKVGKRATVSRATTTPCGTDDGVTFAYAWSVGKKVLSTATAFTPTRSIAGRTLSFKVTALDDGQAVDSRTIGFGRIRR